MYLAEHSVECAKVLQNEANEAVFCYIYYFTVSIVFQSVDNNP